MNKTIKRQNMKLLTYYNKNIVFQEKKAVAKEKYKKNLTNIFELMHKYGNTLDAIDNSRTVHQNKIKANTIPAKSESCTTIYKFFDKIDERSDELGLILIKNILN